MDTVFGLPAHPLLVHVPIVMLPLAAIGVIVMIIRPQWHRRYRWAVLVLGAVGTLGAILAASAGEELERRIEAVEGADAASSWEHHAELGDTARGVAIAFFVVLVAFVLVPWWLERRRPTSDGASTVDTTADRAPVVPASKRDKILIGVVAALAVLGAAASVTTIVQAGHTGSESVWEDYVKDTNG
jgi:hypothetical protein